MAAVSTSVSQQPIPGDKKSPTAGDQFLVRPLRLSDIPSLGEQSRRAYWLSPVSKFLTPRAPSAPKQSERIYCQGIRRRYTNPAVLSLVACPSTNPEIPLAYVQHIRLGDDEGALNFVRERGRVWRFYLYFLTWVFWIYDKVDMWLVPDTISDMENVKTFNSWSEVDRAKYWAPYPERMNRWHTITLVVSPEYQGKGIGKLLMAEVLKRAQSERVPCGLNASAHGEHLYRKLGFTFLGDFTHRVEEEIADDAEPGGGYLCWFPEGWESKGD